MIEQEEKPTVILNSASYFMLPMLQLNKSSYGVGNFINSYVDKNGYLLVDLVSMTKVGTATIHHPQYVTDFNIGDGIRVVYAVPDEFMSDVRKFIEGKYSEFSAALKVAISKYSNLAVANIHIKCLNPQKEDRQKIADDLGVRVDLVKELKSAPAECNFIKIK